MASFDDRLSRIKTLIEQRETIDAELAGLIGEAPRKIQRCSVCNLEGHSARTCPTKQGQQQS